MDLSQQELPLTAYFTRGRREAKSRAVPHRKGKLTEDSDPQSVTHPSKRRKSNAQCSTASPLGSSAGQAKSRSLVLQLPTPATPARKRMHGGRLKVPIKTQLMSTGALSSSVEQNAILPSEKEFVQLKFGPTPSKLPQSAHSDAEDSIPELSRIPLATPSTDRRKTTKPIDAESPPGPRHSSHAEIGIVTPRTLSRISEPLRRTCDHSSLARSDCHFPSKPSQASPKSPDSGVSHATPPHVQHSSRSTEVLPCLPFDLDFPDPFYTREKNRVFVPRNDAFVPPKQYPTQSERLDGQPSNGRAVPMIAVPSSQSQYLLRLDATPKHKRCSRHIERVMSSQTQEERELTLSTPHKPTAMASLSLGLSPGKYTRENGQIPRLSCSERKSQRVYTRRSTVVGSPINLLASPSRSFFASNKALDELSSKSPIPSRHERLTSYHSPGCKIRTPRGSPRYNPAENIPPAPMEDSLTESESDSDIFQMKMKGTLDLLPREINQVPRHSPVAPDPCPPIHRKFAEVDIPAAENDSATEAESDTEILHCIAEIGKKRPHDHRSEASKEDTPPPRVISPLVSPARSRIATVPSIIGFTQFPTQESAGLSIPGSSPSYPSGMEQSQIPSESLPSVVRNFIRMFPGDESYPADFPESLRV